MMLFDLKFRSYPKLTKTKKNMKIENKLKMSDDEWDIFLQNKRLGSVINIGSALEAENEGDWGVTLKEHYFPVISKIGFNSIRLPIGWFGNMLHEKPFTIRPAFLKRIDWAIGQASKNNLNVVIDVHNMDELMNEPLKYMDLYLSIWKQLSVYFRDYDSRLYFELLNEPYGKLDADLWNVFLNKAIGIIRKDNPKRSLVIATAQDNEACCLYKLNLPDDKHLIVSAHYYHPFTYTHQEANWIEGSYAWTGQIWHGSYSDLNAMNFDIKKIADWGIKNNRPINIGEYGAYSRAERLSRLLFVSYVTNLFRKYEFSFGYWEFCAGFGIYNDKNGSVDVEMVKAIFDSLSTFQKYHANVKFAKLEDKTPPLLLDDFSGYNNKMLLQSPLALIKAKHDNISIDEIGNSWYLTHGDSCYFKNKNDEILTKSNGERYHTLIVKEKVNYLYCSAIMDGNDYPEAAVNIDFAGKYSKEWFDLSNLTSISFRARGKGLLGVSFITYKVLHDYVEEETWGHFGNSVGLGDEWHTFVIKKKDIFPAGWSLQEKEGLVWDEANTKVKTIQFGFGVPAYEGYDECELYLDNVKLYGVDYSAFCVGK